MVLLLGGRLHESCDLVVFLGDELLDLLMEFSFKRISCVEGIRGSFFIIHTLIDMIHDRFLRHVQIEGA